MSDKPNIVIIMADQLRWDTLGDHTPNINQLKTESVVFDRAYCASPLCVPARGAFFTGKYPNITG
ncbi:sulfatase-like hydrolase/transferase [Paenibacillus sp. RC67]|uniref:sulfatase-like hydrolase/transferase n=1 Tax=Paenibacillus sp. RC67 TaxID=3039392 RepID=UPI0024AC9AF8|nr:sulfatase-like hydrolase/transferase [Paenibacillus sp. RC67]